MLELPSSGVMPTGRYARMLLELMRDASLSAGLVDRDAQPLRVSSYTAQAAAAATSGGWGVALSPKGFASLMCLS